MNVQFSPKIMNDMAQTLQSTLARDGIINLPKLAEEIRQRNEDENIALEDIAMKLMEKAQILHATIEFDTWVTARQ
jgi:hypothetical protein